MPSNNDRYHRGRREHVAKMEELEQLPKHKCSTFLKVRNKLLIPQTGTCVLNRSLWVNGRYVGQVERLVVYEDNVPDLSFPEDAAQRQMPPSEYEFIYHERTE